MKTKEVERKVVVIQAMATGNLKLARTEAQDLVNGFLRTLVGKQGDRKEIREQARLLLQLEQIE